MCGISQRRDGEFGLGPTELPTYYAWFGENFFEYVAKFNLNG